MDPTPVTDIASVGSARVREAVDLAVEIEASGDGKRSRLLSYEKVHIQSAKILSRPLSGWSARFLAIVAADTWEEALVSLRSLARRRRRLH